MPNSITAKTGNAPVKKLGHTRGQMYGTNNRVQKVGGGKPVDEKAK